MHARIRSFTVAAAQTATLVVAMSGPGYAADPPPPAAHDKAAPVMGEGAHRYRWTNGWLKLPPGFVIGPMHGDVVIDAKDRVYFSTETPNPIIVADAQGTVLRAIGQGVAVRVHGMRLAKEGGKEVLWTADVATHEVCKLSLDGQKLQTLPFPDAVKAYTKRDDYIPTALDVADNGDIYVADGYGRYYVHQFRADGSYVRSWNGSEGGGRFQEPHGIGIDRRGPEPRVVVADRRNHRLQRFTLDGKFVDVIRGDLRLPSKVVQKGDDLLVVDLEGRVTLFDKDFKVVAQLGDNTDPATRGRYNVPSEAWQPGIFVAPHGAAWDSHGNLFVSEWNSTGRFDRLDRLARK